MTEEIKDTETCTFINSNNTLYVKVTVLYMW